MKLFRLLDRLSAAAAFVAQVLLLVLTAAMLFEVVSRYFLNQPTVWAFDISYMMLGSAFLLGCAWTIKVDGHVRVDFFSQKLSPRVFELFSGVMYLCIVAPIFAAFTWQGFRRTLRAYQIGEVETVSIWAPVMWPFYAAIALGLFLFTLQLVAQGIRYLAGEIEPEGSHS